MASNNDEFSGSDSDDDGFKEDMEALRRACTLTGTNPNHLQSSSSAPNPVVSPAYDHDSEEDDLELVRSIQRRFSIPVTDDDEQPLNLKPLCSIPPPGSDGECEDDFETLRAIQRRFGDYTGKIVLVISNWHCFWVI